MSGHARFPGNKLATASADGLARVYNVFTGACTALL